MAARQSFLSTGGHAVRTSGTAAFSSTQVLPLDRGAAAAAQSTTALSDLSVGGERNRNSWADAPLELRQEAGGMPCQKN